MPHRFLIVEDETVVRNFAVAVLQGGGHEVMAADSVEKARRLLAEHSEISDLCLVIDVVLDHDSGITFTQELIETHPNFRFLLISGFTDDVLMIAPGHASRVSFLKKPFGKTELLSAVDKICGSGAKA